MWGALQLCRCTQSLRAAQGRLSVSHVSGMRNGFSSTSLVSRQLITQAKHSKANSWKGLRVSYATLIGLAYTCIFFDVK